jgi:hypothetical protein
MLVAIVLILVWVTSAKTQPSFTSAKSPLDLTNITNDPLLKPPTTATQKLLSITTSDRELMKTPTETDFVKLGDQLRVFKKVNDFVWKSEINSRFNKEVKEAVEFLAEIDNILFPWLKPSFSSTLDLRQSFTNKDGIVLCSGNHHTKMAIATIKMIREIYKCDLPVEVFYIGDGDLSVQNRELYEEIPRVKTRNIEKLFDNDILKLGGWAVKTFSILASSFKNTMLIDADVVFLQSPQKLFDSLLFKKHGALFYHDRSLFGSSDETQNWFKSFMPKPQSKYSKSFRIFNKQTGHEQESGVVLINKEMVLPGLLASCTLNVDKIRNQAYEQVFGDKETFWLGFESVQESYIFSPNLPGTAGVVTTDEKSEKKHICARQLMHVDDKGVPMWINGGIAELKYEEDSPVAKLENYITEDVEHPGGWDLKASNMACLDVRGKVQKFSKDIEASILMSGAILLRERIKMKESSG